MVGIITPWVFIALSAVNKFILYATHSQWKNMKGDYWLIEQIPLFVNVLYKTNLVLIISCNFWYADRICNKCWINLLQHNLKLFWHNPRFFWLLSQSLYRVYVLINKSLFFIKTLLSCSRVNTFTANLRHNNLYIFIIFITEILH